MDENWFGSTIETPTTPMVDNGTGRPLILRTFEFAIRPGQLRRPTEQELFNAHWEHIKTAIKFDGLTANTDVDPRVVIGKKRYRIFILCEPRMNSQGVKETVIEKAKSLQDVFKNKLTK